MGTLGSCSNNSEQISNPADDSTNLYNQNHTTLPTESPKEEFNIGTVKQKLLGKWILSGTVAKNKEEAIAYEEFISHCKKMERPALLADTLTFIDDEKYERVKYYELDNSSFRSREYSWEKAELEKERHKKYSGIYEITDKQNVIFSGNRMDDSHDSKRKLFSVDSDSLFFIDTVSYTKKIAIIRKYFKAE